MDRKHATKGMRVRIGDGTRIYTVAADIQPMTKLVGLVYTDHHTGQEVNVGRVNHELLVRCRQCRADVLMKYEVDEEGMITTPGKFFLEPVCAPYFWNVIEDGAGPDETLPALGCPIYVFYISRDDIDEFPELKLIKSVRLTERDNHVYCSRTLMGVEL